MMRYIDAAERAWRKAQSDWEKARREASQRLIEDAAVELARRPQPEPAAEPRGFVSFPQASAAAPVRRDAALPATASSAG
jgi:hypothetical protein